MVSSEIVEEYLEVINRPKFQLRQVTLDRVIRYIYEFSEFVAPTEYIYEVVADPKDNKFLEAALAGNVDAIVSGDNHLLALKTFRTIPILSAREFIEQLTH